MGCRETAAATPTRPAAAARPPKLFRARASSSSRATACSSWPGTSAGGSSTRQRLPTPDPFPAADSRNAGDERPARSGSARAAVRLPVRYPSIEISSGKRQTEGLFDRLREIDDDLSVIRRNGQEVPGEWLRRGTGHVAAVAGVLRAVAGTEKLMRELQRRAADALR